MTDWSKLKVVDLKEECKARGIPLTGLKLKQQYIDKLAEHEAQNGDGDISEQDVNGTEEAGAQEETETHPNGENTEPDDQAIPPSNHTEQKHLKADEVDNGRPQESRDEHQAEDVLKDAEQKAEVEQQPSDEPTNREDALLVPEPGRVDEQFDATKAETVRESESSTQPEADKDEPVRKGSTPAPGSTGPGQQPVLQSAPIAPVQALSDSSSSSGRADDERKRRKRSATPIPSEEDVARKKARLSTDGESLTIEQLSALEQIKSATETAKTIRGETANGAAAEVIVEEPEADVTATTGAVGEPEKRKDAEMPSASPRRSRSPSEERDVVPAVHPATSTLYIRNFKRPLHIPSLRSHIASVARSRSSSDDSDPITLFYLDSIRTHAFISFASVAAASRVRSVMHDARYPNESMREPLFVDYVPNDKVQSWIDQETGGGFGGRGGSGRRFEVVYEEHDDGVEAIFQDVDANRPQPPLQPSRSSRMSIDRPGPESLPVAVHPDREAFVPRESGRDRERDRSRVHQSPAVPKNAESSGRGFKALDELFEFTTAKPKLYYKPVSESIAADRADSFRGLRVGYAHMGRSGDEGMKRYTFERYKGREEWVDKGPEFGFGKRGQDRLAGVRGRGGYRGRGDSWRGGGAAR